MQISVDVYNAGLLVECGKFCQIVREIVRENAK